MIILSVTAYTVITGDPSLTVCGLFHPLFSHPSTVNTAGKHGSKQPLHQISCRAHVSAFVVCVMCPPGLPAPKLQNERVGGRGIDGTYQGWPSLQA